MLEIKPCQGLCSVCCTPLKGSAPPCWPQGPHHHTTPHNPSPPPPHPLQPCFLLAPDGEGSGEMERHAGMQGVTSAPAGVSALSSVPGAACSGLARSPAGGGRAQASWTLLVPPRPPTKFDTPTPESRLPSTFSSIFLTTFTIAIHPILVLSVLTHPPEHKCQKMRISARASGRG